ncbi:DeoR family transcriptional regulator [Bacillus mangrovi]|uniref:DeoR family transcriptional regulator n=1 Tax=Metabacillus mangrovi TaxID=1491830 RepID=A0A7X2V4E4_9BACI|nr:DeoR/GlpR family DNA-binding transcription regulator [Metabacillus mangrovi]MTH53041.1 DeoR family transcriptional regulator [Metabacillus mangrovi]
MHFIERHEQILLLLQKEKMIKVTELSQSFAVTEKTIRQDLIMLEKQGLLKRIYGGAVLPKQTEMLPVDKRQASFIFEKKEAAQAAAARIEENDTVFLDGGSTMLELAKLLHGKKLTVVTNDLNIAHSLLGAEQIQLIVPGGAVIPASAALYGPIAQEALKGIRVKKLFLGTTAADPVNGLTVFSHLQAAYKKSIMKLAEQVILVTDHTKFGQTALFRYASLEDADEIITDSGLSDSWRNKLEDHRLPMIYGSMGE